MSDLELALFLLLPDHVLVSGGGLIDDVARVVLEAVGFVGNE